MSRSDLPAARGLGGALGFLTVVGPSTPPTPSALGWFPAAGVVLGGLVGGIWWLAGEIWPPLLAAVVAVAADAALTGALHHDGLADAADGLLPHLDRDRRLEVMRRPDVGAFGMMALVTVSLLRVGALASLDPRPALVAGLWCASRTTMAVTARRVPYARETGLATAFLGGAWVPVATMGAVISIVLAAWASGAAGMFAVAAVGLVAAAVVALAVRRIGGFTGDVLGAAGVVGETAGLLVVAASW